MNVLWYFLPLGVLLLTVWVTWLATRRQFLDKEE